MCETSLSATTRGVDDGRSLIVQIVLLHIPRLACLEPTEVAF